MVRYKNLLFRALLQRSHTKINLCNIPLSIRLLSDQNKKLLRRFFVKQDHPVQVLWIYLFFFFMGKCKKSTQCSEIVLCKALEYKVRPYGLLFSWYTLSIRSFLRGQNGKLWHGTTIFAYLRTRETSGIDHRELKIYE